jgi:UDP-glucose 4-epimerase
LAATRGVTPVDRAGKERAMRVVVISVTGNVYSPAPKNRAMDESRPVDGIPTLYYSLQKAEVEQRLDHFESQNPDIRVVRFRPAPAFKRESA